MPVVEKYGLMVLFGLCALIVGVGIFAEDPLTEKALRETQTISTSAGVQPVNNESVSLDDSQGTNETDYFPEDVSEHGKSKLKSFEDPRGNVDPDPRRQNSLDLDEGDLSLLEKPKGPEVKPAPKPALKPREYRVRKGDSLSRIAKRELGNGSEGYVDQILSLNPQIKNKKIYSGKTILIPNVPGSKKASVAKKSSSKSKDRRITIKKNQSLRSIAKKYYGNENKWKALARHNGIKDDRIFTGKKLSIPADL